MATQATTSNVGELRFANAEDGWAFSPGLYATYDGGQQWQAINLGGNVDELEPGLGKVYAVVFPGPVHQTCGTQAGNQCPTFQLWISSITTQSWSIDPAARDLAGALAVHGTSVYLQPSNPQGDYASGLLVSTDSGEHFARVSNLGYDLPCHYSPVTDEVIWAFCSSGNFGGASISTDDGMTFSSVNFGGPNSSSIEGASPTVAVAVSGASGQPLEQTTNAGKTFSVVQPAPSQTTQWDLIGFTNPDDGYAFSYDPATGPNAPWTLWHTTDGGGRWSTVPIG